MDSALHSFIILAVYIVVCIFIFLAIRAGVLWYFKIDQTIQLLREIRDLLANQVAEPTFDPEPSGQLKWARRREPN